MSERWRIHPGFPAYEISNQGRVRRIGCGHGAVPGRILKAYPNPDTGYLSVQLGRGHRRTVHSLVLEAFVGACPDGRVARHLDEVKSNNSLGNLRWGTYSENYSDRVAHGGGNHGSRHGMAELTEADVLSIRAHYVPKVVTQKMLATKHGVSRECIKLIVNRQRWTHI